MIEYRYKYPNRKKSKPKLKNPWMESDYYDGKNNDVDFDLVDVRISNRIFTKRSELFIAEWEKEFIWRALND